MDQVLLSFPNSLACDIIPLMNSERIVHDIFTKRRLTLASAESCSGGLISHRITDIPGSSEYFKGGVVAYSNDVKIALLNVPRKLIQNCGAVSPEVAAAMAIGARKALRADVAVSVTGIAGPAGATYGKPVGLAYIAVAAEDGARTEKVNFKGSRAEVKEKFAEAALGLLVETMKRGKGIGRGKGVAMGKKIEGR